MMLRIASVITFLLLALTLLSSSVESTALKKRAKVCTLPKNGEPYGTATPEEAGFDPDKLAKAVTFAQSRNRISLQIFRRGCLVATGLLDPVTDQVPNNVWSCTKSVISLLTGIAIDRGLLGLHDRIGPYLPKKPGWGDAAHRNLTVFQLLTETAGMREAILSEAATVGIEASAPQAALAQPFEHTPGTYFEYSQRVPDLLAYVVQRAVKQDLQKFAQKNLFDPVGIKIGDYFWLRDRTNHTYGYAWLFLKPSDLARLGHLALNFGKYNDQRVVSESYVKSATSPSKRNPCYSWLFWNNGGKPCTAANIPAAQTYYRYPMPAAPKDTFLMVGALQQNNFMTPSLDLLTTWTGVLGDLNPNLAIILSAAPGDLYNNYYSLLMDAITDADVPHRGFLKPDNLSLDITPTNYFDPDLLLSNIVTSPSCNVLFCNGIIPIGGLLDNLQSIATIL